MSSDARKKQQWIVLGLIGGGLLLIIIVLGQVMNRKQAAFRSSGAPDRVDETIIADRTSNASPELSWARQSREQIDQLNKTVTELTNTVKGMAEKQASDLEELRTQYDEVIVQQQAEINSLKTGAPVPAVGGETGEAQAPGYGQEFVSGGTRTPAAGRAGQVALPVPALPVRRPWCKGSARAHRSTSRCSRSRKSPRRRKKRARATCATCTPTSRPGAMHPPW